MRKISKHLLSLSIVVLCSVGFAACGNNVSSSGNTTLQPTTTIAPTTTTKPTSVTPTTNTSTTKPTTTTQTPTTTKPTSTVVSTANPSDEYVPNKEYDVVVYGDTAAAVVAAVAASRNNAKVVIVAPNKHLGGMVSGGLSQTDLGDSSVIGGMSREFFKRNAIKKGGSKQVDWYFEPHVAEEIFNDMIEETKATDYGVEVFLGERLVEKTGVVMSDDNTIEQIICESGKTFKGKHFIDASYEGDLMAQSGVSYTFGRESKDEYDESLAGVVSPTVAGADNHNFKYKIKAYDDNGKLKYQEVSEEPLAEIGSGDKKIQAYNFRMVLTNDESNKIAFPRPEGYDAERYKLLGDYLNAWYDATKKAPTAHELFGFRDGVNNKWDFNNKGAFSTDFIGGNYGYPDGTYAERDQIWQEHYKYTAGLLYFLANDPSVPDATRNEVASYGLPKDEYQDSNNWTFQLYVREGRRMLGEYIMTQKDIEKNGKYLTKPDTIGMGSYNSDSHNVQRYITSDGYVRNEGNMEVKVDPYEIPYRTLLPKKQEADNLLVTCTLSASHVAYSTIRMEPQYMIIGQAAGTAAAIATQDGTQVHDINVAKLQHALEQTDAVLTKTQKDNTPTYSSDVVVYDSLNNWKSGWSKSQNSDSCALEVTQNDSYISVDRGYAANYGFITKTGFIAPTTDFTFSFRVRLNSKSDSEFTIRNKGYLVSVVLTNDGNGSGKAMSGFASGSKSYSLDTSIWHDYNVVVRKDSSKYMYDLYVDGQLAWTDAYLSSGFSASSTDILKIGNDGVSKTNGTGVSDLDLDYIKVQKGAKTDELNYVGHLFRDSYHNKVSNVVSSLAFNDLILSLFMENGASEEQTVLVKIEVSKDGAALDDYAVNEYITLKSGELKDIDVKINVPEDKEGLQINAQVYYGEDYSDLLVDNIILK